MTAVNGPTFEKYFAIISLNGGRFSFSSYWNGCLQYITQKCEGAARKKKKILNTYLSKVLSETHSSLYVGNYSLIPTSPEFGSSSLINRKVVGQKIIFHTRCPVGGAGGPVSFGFRYSGHSSRRSTVSLLNAVCVRSSSYFPLFNEDERIFSDISRRNNDYSDALDFRIEGGEVGVVTYFVWQVPNYKSATLMYSYYYLYVYVRCRSRFSTNRFSWNLHGWWPSTQGWTGPIVFESDRPNRTTDMAENIPPKPVFRVQVGRYGIFF